MEARKKLQDILNGEINFYFRFKRIGVYKNGTLLDNLTDNNSPGGGSTFRRSAAIAKIDFDEEGTWAIIQRLGLFRNMCSNFDLWLDFNGWQLNSDTHNEYSIFYPIQAGGIDYLLLIAEGNHVRLQIVSGNYALLLTDVLNFH